MQELLKMARKILHEIDENITVHEPRKVGMKVAVGYMLDEVHSQFQTNRIERKVSLGLNAELIKNFMNEFDAEIGYSPNDNVYKQYNSLMLYFTPVNKK